MNHIQLEGYTKAGEGKSPFIATKLSINELASKVRQLQDFLSRNNYVNNIVDVDTIVDFIETFGLGEAIDEEEAMKYAIENGQYVMVSEFQSDFWYVNVLKAALGIEQPQKIDDEYEE